MIGKKVEPKVLQALEEGTLVGQYLKKRKAHLQNLENGIIKKQKLKRQKKAKAARASRKRNNR